MAELKIYLSESLNERFRKIAMSIFGYGRGSLSKAAEEALAKWCAQHVDSKQPESAKVENARVQTTQISVNLDERQSRSPKST